MTEELNQNLKKILIAEDEKPVARALELKFSHAGFLPVMAANGEEVLKALETATFDLILLDLIMPKFDGFAVLAELKKRGNIVPIIVTSNLGQSEDQQRAKELGAKEYFVKSNTPIMRIVEYAQSLCQS
jgi:DNA-binding response OmpR family regulator